MRPVLSPRTTSPGPGVDRGTKAGFQLAREALNSRVEDVDIDVMDLSPERVGTFDIVLFLGVLYHLKHPLLALERVASVTRQLLILETVVDMVGIRRPAAAFYPATELSGDPTNWWGPNVPAIAWDAAERRVRPDRNRDSAVLNRVSCRSRGGAPRQRQKPPLRGISPGSRGVSRFIEAKLTARASLPAHRGER